MAIFLITLFFFAAICPNCYANAEKGMKVYKKFLKSKTGIDGGKFAALHTQEEWRALFENDAKPFIEECAEKFPHTLIFIKSEKFNRLKEHLFDFLYKYASDSGNIPSC
jgi:hypothetical protein